MGYLLFIMIIIAVCSKKQSDSSTLCSSSDRPKRKETSVHVTNENMTLGDEIDAQFGRGDYVGKTGSPFIDDPFFNPWAPCGDFNK